MITENLSTLKIHKLTQEQYDREFAAGRIDESALYLTPDEEIDLSEYATVSYVDEKFAAVPEFDPSEIQAAIDTKVDAVDGMGLSTNDYTDAEKDKLDSIEANANFYEHPVHTSHDSGLYKVTVDGEGHVSSVALAEKEDIVALGIPAQDTTHEEEISDLNDRIDDVENGINITNETLSGLSEELESYKTTNNEAVATNTSAIEVNKTTIEEIQSDYLTSVDRTQLQDSINQVSDKVTENTSAIDTLNGEGDGSVKRSIDNAFDEFAANVTNDDVINTYKELIDYAAKHGPEFTKLVGNVEDINTRVGGISDDLSNYKTSVSDQFTEVNTLINDMNETLEDKSDLDHTHEIDGVNGLQELLDELQADIKTNEEDISTKADSEHAHNDLYYTKDEVLESITVDDIDNICESNQLPDVDDDFISSYIKLDSTLTKSGQAADAKVVGDEVNAIKSLVGNTPVSKQIQDAVEQKTQVQFVIWEADD